MTSTPAFGDLVRDWRARRRMTQMDLALEADISPRHMSFLETGRSRPSREMVLRLAERLELPLRDRNHLLTAAGFAAVFPQRALDDPGLAAARRAVDLILAGHEPHPALAVDRGWNLLAANSAALALMGGLAPELLTPPVNVLRASLHPGGLASRILNLSEWRAHVLERLRLDLAITADPKLAELLAELSAYPAPPAAVGRAHGADYGGVAIPMRLASDQGPLSFISTTTLFGTAVDVTLSELILETFFAADEHTAKVMGEMAAARAARSAAA
ncbi:helix-turn-helix domain-containing protein [Caulobacter sp. SLTY]|uniref:helix-turn-helix transcriptional regulator n=1 Tax=Caulobacter sp. SLTY TaxID=2683262 RepID=UPI001412FEB6|nr:helix-turn-helix transcriptional regulator [Caulobacter sp. SLTY]NBB15263.1 helix-turn-helix domain-containing protein [Caulobacter sp. SLTY]